MKDQREVLKDELNSGDIISDHPFIAAKNNPYLCGFTRGDRVCRLAEAAHEKAVTPYRTDAPVAPKEVGVPR